MRRTFALMALIISAAFFTACTTAENTNTNVNTSANTNGTGSSNANTSSPGGSTDTNMSGAITANTSRPTPTPKKTDRITVHYPSHFLQDDRDVDAGKVTFELEEVFERVIPTTTINGNTTQRTDIPDRIEGAQVGTVRPEADPNKYDVYVEVGLLTKGLTKTDPPNLKRLYKGQREVWEWKLKPAEGSAEGLAGFFRFQVNVTWQAKSPDVSTREISDIYRNIFPENVGPPASRVNAALYSSPLFAAGGFVAFGTSIRRRRDLPGAELEEEGIEDTMMPVKEANLEDEKTAAEDEVSSTVYAPGQAGPGDSFLVQVFVHLPEQAASLDEIAKEADEDARRRITSMLQKKVKRGTELTFHLLMPGLEVDEPVQPCVWNGEPSCVQFGVTVPENCKPRNIIGTVTVSEKSVPIGHLKFKFKITGDASSEADASSRQPVPVGNMIRYQQAFISYASKDRPEVLKRVQMLNLAKIKFFQDLLTLEPGDSWEKLLYEYIDKSDVFFLFWSTAASESEWVRKEVEYAIKRKTGHEEFGPEIIPVIIEGPPPAKPPSELGSLHFNDKLIYFINTRETEAKPLDG